MSTRLAATPQTVELYVSPEGNDNWSGRLPAANSRSTDGPLASVQAALKIIRKLRAGKPLATPVRVNLRGGLYQLKRPITITPADCGTAAIRKQWTVVAEEVPVTFAAYRREKPVLSGGRVITGFKQRELGGRPVWVASLPAVKAGKWNFRSLYVNGERRWRPRLGGMGEFRVQEILDEQPPNQAPWRPGVTRFRYAAGDLRNWHNLRDVEIVLMHLWMESRVKIARLDEAQRIVHLDRETDMRPIKTHLDEGLSPYYIENVFEAIGPGQFYLDRPAGLLYYMPKKGERLDRCQIVAPVLEEVLRLQGNPKAGKWVEAVHFKGLTLAHSEYRRPEDRAAFSQASAMLPGAVVAEHARWCSWTNCRLTGHDEYAIELRAGCQDVTIQGNLIDDNGGGGVKVWHTEKLADNPRTTTPAFDSCRRITIADNEIANCGHHYLSAVGVLIGRCCGNRVLHNHVHHLYYTGLSIGWTWGYGDENNTYGNIVEHNHVHHIGQGILSDMGGIYTLGLQTGLRIRYNVFHHVESRGYGGWGIYPDEGTSNALIEFNLVYDCNRSSFHQHFGRDNFVQNNIFAFAGRGQLAITRSEAHTTVNFLRNIVIYSEGAMLHAPEGGFMFGKYSPANVTFDYNLYFKVGGKASFDDRSFAQWQKLGFDPHGKEADPRFVNAQRRNFALKDNSPAYKLGFQKFDLSSVGPREEFAYKG